MASVSRIGPVRIAVSGAWDIDDLRQVSEAFSEIYGLFYPLVATDDAVASHLHELLQTKFWTGDIETRHFGAVLYREIPQEERLKLKSFQYASPGAFELTGVMAVLLMLSTVARSWIKTSDAFLSLWERVGKFFEKRKSLRKPPKKTVLDDEMADSSDEARELVFELGANLGFDALSCERLIDILGNPISTLKYLVMAGSEGRKLSTLQDKGLLTLPMAPKETITIPQPAKAPRRTRQGVPIETVGRKRKRPSDSSK